MRIGIVGTENSHVDHIVHHLNIERRHDARVVALAGGNNARNKELATAGKIERIVDSVAELLPLADALVVTDRHGGRHRANAMPFLEAGRPVFVDKPLACGVADAEAMISAARNNNAPLTSYSALRWLPEFTETRAALPILGEPRLVMATGAADPEDEHGGLFFYGPHPVSIAFGLLPPGPISDVHVIHSGPTVIANCQVGEVRVQVNLLKPNDTDEVPFHLQVIGSKGVSAREFTLTDEYLLGGLAEFITMMETGIPPIPYDMLLREVEFLEKIHEALR